MKILEVSKCEFLKNFLKWTFSRRPFRFLKGLPMWFFIKFSEAFRLPKDDFLRYFRNPVKILRNIFLKEFLEVASVYFFI